MIRLWTLGACALALAPLTAQEPAWILVGVPGRQIGSFDTADIGDINGDGHPDIASIVHGVCGGGYTGNYLWLVSGRDGVLIREVAAPQLSPPLSSFGRVAAAGDWNDDGVADYAVTGAGTDVRSGLDDSLLWQPPPFAWREVLGDLDVDGDDLEDLVVGSWSAFGALGRITVYSHSGNELYTLSGGNISGHTLFIANELAALGDVDGDGADDFVSGCWEPTGVGCGAVFSGKNGNLINVGYGQYPLGNIGLLIDSCGDLDADGITDYVTSNGGTIFTPAGIVAMFSGRTGAMIHQIVDAPPSSFGSRIASQGVDLDGDGLADTVVGATSYYNGPSSNVVGAIFVHSGRDAGQLHFINQPIGGTLGVWGALGGWVSILRPRAEEHTGLILALDRNCCPAGPCGSPRGAIRAFRGAPRTSQILGPSCAGNLTSPPDIGMRTIAGGVRIHLAHAPPNVAVVLMVGLSTTSYAGVPLPVALDPLGFPGCSLRTSIELTHVTMTGSTGIDAGYAFVDLPYPIPATGLGTWSVSAQWLVLGDAATFPGGLTQAIRWRR